MPADDLKALVAWLKANPDKASAATSGVGSLQHVAALDFQTQTGTRFAVVPYRGGAPAMHDLVAGQIDLMLDTAADVVEHVRAGNIKAYAVTAKSRSATAPGIPTVDEAGLPGMYFPSWQAFFAPKTTPKDAIAKLNAAIKVALADPTVRQRLADIGQEIFPRDQQTPEALRCQRPRLRNGGRSSRRPGSRGNRPERRHLKGGAMVTKCVTVPAMIVMACAVQPVPTVAQTYPSRPIRIVVPFPPAGPTDALARVLGEQIGRAQGATIVIENRPGAGGVIGTETVTRATPNGATLLITPNSFVVDPHLRKVNYITIH